jgi:hypothetical protein
MKAGERWGSSGQFAILQQLGAEPQTEEARAGEGQQKGLTDKIRDTLGGQ